MNKKFIYWAVGIVAFLGFVGSTTSSHSSSAVVGVQTSVAPTEYIAPTDEPTAIPVNTIYVKPTQAPTYQAPAQSGGLSNDNYYTNSDGNTVHSPAYANSAPAGATAQCGDGTYSFSQHRSGTCS